MSARLVLRLLLSALFLFAGTLHLLRPALFLPLMPPWIPLHLLSIEVSGVFELLGGAGLLIPNRSTQVLSGWGLVLLLVAVFPANIYMAFSPVRIYGIPAWIAWLRLPLQPVLMVGVAWASGAWPRKCV